MLLQDAGQRKNIPDVVVHDERLAPGQRGIVLVQVREHPALLRRKVPFHPVQEQRRLVEEAVRRLHVLDDDCLGQPPQLGFLSLRELLPCVDDHGNL